MPSKLTIKELREICQIKEEDKRPNCIGYFYRRVSIYITAYLIKTNITANQVSGITFIFGLLGALFLSFGQYNYRIFGGIILCFYVLFDNVDGEVARYRKYFGQSLENPSGKFCETMNHNLTTVLVLLSISFSLFKVTSDIRVFIFGFLASFCFTLSWTIRLYVQAYSLGTAENNFKYSINDRKIIIIFQKMWKTIFNFFSYTFVPTMVLIMAVLDRLYLFIVLYSIYLFFYTIYLGITSYLHLNTPSQSIK